MTDIESELIKMLRAERERNDMLMEILLEREGLIHEPIKIVSEDAKSLIHAGKEPWHIRRQKLERMFKKPSLSEVTGIPEDSPDVNKEPEENVS